MRLQTYLTLAFDSKVLVVVYIFRCNLRIKVIIGPVMNTLGQKVTVEFAL